MPAWVYILKCADGSYYVGSTTNLPLRLVEHQSGEGGVYTRTRLPVESVFSYEFQSDQEAFVRERQIKGWSRVKKEALIRGDFGELIRLSKSHTRQAAHRPDWHDESSAEP